MGRAFGRWLLWLVLAGLALQLYFLAGIALMAVLDPHSTAFQRSEAWRVATASVRGETEWRWRQRWVDGEQISPHLWRAVVASEDAGFFEHGGVDWEAIEKAWQKNERRQEQAERRAARNPNGTAREPKVVGGSTITQQLAKNLLLSGERNLLRKGQELVLSLMLELVLDKRRILEIYLNSVEWGEGVFGAEAAAQRYFNKPAARLNAHEAARLAVMLPSPRFFETRQGSAYLARRTGTIVARMGDVKLP
ncbi:MAG: monofunctional biosynthetic peptidoglycan transglycosylase [Hydrogenophaga sp.]|uniref:monofunctional biosynthetic peptidoglycan transglycosylase n=1 Tax=Hydrogenophaga sp. TaxID=1904254 RepID=UPI0016A1EFD6|nr:monofunctional biosynthetic peptidoglycan transglycosylase [Hydrogenophaga sp.]NIM42496.1 monofunctional biosynthetic peptidoglycan transglycosylase [Hydrogenophaga sp.]NIN27647.1 monofunctional biosynthetic peptidoglycan transglycosylase [Hydrogenophaga sp.]NIN32467.1 monofunctional biosynthetic peptidoglycan transglycosylase [Hydrogenophaga sp.]NIN56918.1 monofunctional biosynthetic peptidoglycan transglycosylase [Hydrogenophaga sp.]NIO53063.1 monofunctional biosynthetic peptidoglycan tra